MQNFGVRFLIGAPSLMLLLAALQIATNEYGIYVLGLLYFPALWGILNVKEHLNPFSRLLKIVSAPLAIASLVFLAYAAVNLAVYGVAI